MFVCWVVSPSFWVWNIIRHRIIVVINFTALCTEYVYIFAKGCHRNKVRILLNLQWNFCFVGIVDSWVSNREVCSIWDFSDEINPFLDILEFHTFIIDMLEDNTPLKILSTLLYSLQITLIY